jgi:hypothetical protein
VIQCRPSNAVIRFCCLEHLFKLAKTPRTGLTPPQHVNWKHVGHRPLQGFAVRIQTLHAYVRNTTRAIVRAKLANDRNLPCRFSPPGITEILCSGFFPVRLVLHARKQESSTTLYIRTRGLETDNIAAFKEISRQKNNYPAASRSVVAEAPSGMKSSALSF